MCTDDQPTYNINFHKNNETKRYFDNDAVIPVSFVIKWRKTARIFVSRKFGFRIKIENVKSLLYSLLSIIIN